MTKEEVEARAEALIRTAGAVMFMVGVLLITISVFLVFGWRVGIGAVGLVSIAVDIAWMQ